jgi:hypothetical protein
MCVWVLSCEQVEGSCLGLFQGTEWTVCCVAEKRRFETSSTLRRILRVGRCNSRLRCSIELIKMFRKSNKILPLVQQVLKILSSLTKWNRLSKEWSTLYYSITYWRDWKNIVRWNVLRSPGWNPKPGHPEIKAVMHFYIRHPPAGIWPRYLYSWFVSPVVKHRIVELAFRVVFTLGTS